MVISTLLHIRTYTRIYLYLPYLINNNNNNNNNIIIIIIIIFIFKFLVTKVMVAAL